MIKKRSNKLNRLKKGVAIELALLLMLAVFALCTLLVSLALISKDSSDKQFSSLEQKLVLDQVGLSFVNANTNEDFSLDSSLATTYTATTSVDGDGVLKLIIKNQSTTQTVFTVMLDSSNKIIEWKYN